MSLWARLDRILSLVWTVETDFLQVNTALGFLFLLSVSLTFFSGQLKG